MREKGTPEYNHFRDVEVITEFHIARDLKSADLPLDANFEPGEEGKPVVHIRSFPPRRNRLNSKTSKKPMRVWNERLTSGEAAIDRARTLNITDAALDPTH